MTVREELIRLHDKQATLWYPLNVALQRLSAGRALADDWPRQMESGATQHTYFDKQWTQERPSQW